MLVDAVHSLPGGTSGSPALGEARRWGVLWVPDWPIAAAIAEGELPAHLPTAMCAGAAVTVVSAQARRLGVRAGMTRRTAQSLVPDLVLGQSSPIQEVRAFEPVLQAAGGVAADVVLLRPGLALVGAAGAARYYGGEEEVANSLVGAAANAGVEAQVGVATGFLSAILAARRSLIVPPDETPGFLFPHPVENLLHAATTAGARKEYAALVSVWQRLGLARLGDVAQLSVADVAGRFGRMGIYAHRLVRGMDIQLHAGARVDADLSAGMDLDPPAQRVDIAAFAARGVAGQLHDLLLGRGLACENLRVYARAENGEELSRAWRLDGLLGVEELTDRVRWQLAGWLDGRSGKPPSAPLVRIDLIAEGNYPAGSAQSGLWGRADRNEEHAVRAAGRVQSLLGAESVLTAAVQGGRTPGERIRYVAWGDEMEPDRDPGAPWPGQLPAPAPATVFARPPTIELTSDGVPVRMTERGGLSRPPDKLHFSNRSHRIEGWAGPWPIHDRWWEGQVPRVYLQVVSDAGAWLVTGGEEGWRVEGVYD